MWGEGQGPEVPALPPHPPPNPQKGAGEGGAFGPAFPGLKTHKGLGEGVWGRIVRGPATPGPLPQKTESKENRKDYAPGETFVVIW